MSGGRKPLAGQRICPACNLPPDPLCAFANCKRRFAERVERPYEGRPEHPTGYDGPCFCDECVVNAET